MPTLAALENMDKHIIIAQKLLDARVCSDGTWDEALGWLQRTNPAGTQNNWQKNAAPNFEPLHCADHPERTHYMFTC
jgi:hypothetical protein